MDVLLLSRAVLPLLLVAFVLILIVWPVLRLRREAGVRAFVLHRDTAPGQRMVALGSSALELGVLALVGVYALRGPEPLGVWNAPPWVTLLGLLLGVAGIALIGVSQRQMGASFRIGIDDAETSLVERGLFGVVRNPIFTGLLVMLAGLVLAVPCVWSVLCWVAAVVGVEWQTRLEERHLLALHGDAYRAYAARVGRFLPGIGRFGGGAARAEASRRTRFSITTTAACPAPTAPQRPVGMEARLLDNPGLWLVYLAVGSLWAAANLVVYWRRTRVDCGLGRIGSSSIWAWDLYLTLGIAAGVVHQPFGFRVPMAGRAVALLAALAGGVLAFRGMHAFRSLARVSALDETRLVTSGVYARVRHPQVAGLLLVAFGLSLAAGTLVGILVAMVFLLWSLAQTRLEDRRLVALFGDAAQLYVARVPAYVPRPERRRRARR